MFDIIITTYNRPSKVVGLINSLLTISGIKSVILVDSSDIYNIKESFNSKVTYIKTHHQNQPYQRFLGYLVAESDLLIFLDDDMEIVDRAFVEKLNSIYKKDSSISGVAIKFLNKHNNTSLDRMPKTKLLIGLGFFSSLKSFLTGYPILKPGKFGSNGIRGDQPKGGGQTEWVSGGAFSARRSSMFYNFNFKMLDLYEDKMGKGEDAILGYLLSKNGKLVYYDELLFLHNDQGDSIYSIDLYSYAKKVSFSRLFLTLERARIDNKGYIFAYMKYHYYIFWRILGNLFNYILAPSEERYSLLSGSFHGWIQSFNLNYMPLNQNQPYWYKEANGDAALATSL